MCHLRAKQSRSSRQFWLLTLFLVLVFLTGGGARPDIQSLLFLRPISVIVFAFGLWTLSREQLRNHQFLFGLLALTMGLVASHLIPLPPALWQSLPGRTIVIEADRLAGFGSIWRPLSLTPAETRNALFSLFVPMAVLVLAVQLNPDEKYRLTFVFLGFIMLSSIIGFLQEIGPDEGPLYFYRISNVWSSTGLFANRNHQALLLALAFPLLAVISSARSAKRTVVSPSQTGAILVGIILIPLLLITGSRAGVVLGAIGILMIPQHLAAQATRSDQKKTAFKVDKRIIGGVIIVALLTLASLVFARAEGINRIFNFNQRDEVRLNVWGPIADAVATFFPFGSGIGSFDATYRMFERASDMSYFYMNHAHNEVLEIALTGGLPAIMIALVALVAWGFGVRRAFFQGVAPSRSVCLSRLGLTILAMVALSSLVDYPLRVPSIAVIAMLAAVWASGSHRPTNDRRNHDEAHPTVDYDRPA